MLSVRPGRSFRAGISSSCADILTADCGHAGLGSGAESAGIGARLEQVDLDTRLIVHTLLHAVPLQRLKAI